MRALLIYLVCLCGIANAQTSVLSKVQETGKTIQTFIPKGYDTIETVKGDLNKDGVDDIVLCLKSLEEDAFDMDEEPKRLLLILFTLKNSYVVKGKSDNALMCRHCGGMYGDPYSGVDIKKGVLQINHYGGSGWRWSESRKFRFQNNAFYLIGSTSDYYANNRPCNGNEFGDAGRNYKDTNWLTGDEEIIQRDEDCKLLEHKKYKLRKKRLVKLENFKYEYQ